MPESLKWVQFWAALRGSDYAAFLRLVGRRKRTRVAGALMLEAMAARAAKK